MSSATYGAILGALLVLVIPVLVRMALRAVWWLLRLPVRLISYALDFGRDAFTDRRNFRTSHPVPAQIEAPSGAALAFFRHLRGTGMSAERAWAHVKEQHPDWVQRRPERVPEPSFETFESTRQQFVPIPPSDEEMIRVLSEMFEAHQEGLAFHPRTLTDQDICARGVEAEAFERVHGGYRFASDYALACGRYAHENYRSGNVGTDDFSGLAIIRAEIVGVVRF